MPFNYQEQFPGPESLPPQPVQCLPKASSSRIATKAPETAHRPYKARQFKKFEKTCSQEEKKNPMDMDGVAF
ncbi:unnamed protein product [Caenorhabditis nigoni]